MERFGQASVTPMLARQDPSPSGRRSDTTPSAERPR